jgi:hypothetical protein
MPAMDVPAVWTIARGADREKVKNVLSRLAERLEIPEPEIKNDQVLLPAEYPRVARALEEVEPGWEDEELLIPPVP